MATTEAQRALEASILSLTRWSRVHGPEARRAQLAPARQGRRTKLEQQAIAEADRDLTPEELEAAVDCLQRAHYRRMALASARARTTTTRRKRAT